MKKRLVSSLFSVMIILAGVYNAYAEMGSSMGKAGEGMPMPPMRGMKHPGAGMMGEEDPMWRRLMALGLDDKQKEAIKEIKDRVMKEMIRKRADEHVAGIELKELLDKDPVNMKTVEAKLNQIETLKTEIQLSLIRATEEAKSKLTPDQRKKIQRDAGAYANMDYPMMEGMMDGGKGMFPSCEKHGEMR
ncbi:MAG TPA: hypothetical protein DCP92_07250 [Nitrospiraceae bacterium]|jgi:Spy/CpxP family protein refolding chaperone|nr:hypothetical protein [Nitrospiraceae bacterium]